MMKEKGKTESERGGTSLLFAFSLILFTFAPVSLAASGPNFVTGTHTVKGMLKDVRNVVLPATSQVRIQATDKDGHILAATTVSDPNDAGYNFGILIPLSKESTDCTAKVGDELNCIFATDDGISVATAPIKVGETDACSTLVFQFVDVVALTNQDKTASVRVPRVYLDEIEAYLASEEQYGLKYDPWGDYDKDGSLNFDEYLSGTNPFDPSDRLVVTSFRITDFENGGTKAAISFEYVGGHLYGVKATPELVKPAWMTRKAAKMSDGSEEDQVLPSANASDVGITTIYVTPAAGTAQEFFKLEAK